VSVIRKSKQVNINTFATKKSKGEKITVLTAYDYFIAGLLDRSGIDAILVGDSAANVIHGHKNTLQISLETMLDHTAAVARGVKRAFIIGDMPFLSYQPSIECAITNAGMFLKAGAQAVKVEGGIEMSKTVERLVECGIPVMGHIGLTPQSINRFGGPKIQGKNSASRNYLIESALALEKAGCFSIVLELVEQSIACEITSCLKKAATIGIGAGKGCDGQVLVTNDMLGLRPEGFKPKFLREYANLVPIISEAISKYVDDVRSSDFPDDSESY